MDIINVPKWTLYIYLNKYFEYPPNEYIDLPQMGIMSVLQTDITNFPKMAFMKFSQNGLFSPQNNIKYFPK